MRIRWRNFELPTKVQADRESLTPQFGRFVVEPFERGFGHTIGNGLRRVLLSSIEGAAVTAVRIQGAKHEFDSLEGIYEDVADIILKIKRLRIRYDATNKIVCRVAKSTAGPVTGADMQCEGGAKIVNTDLQLCTLTMDRDFQMEVEVNRGRGYISADDNRSTDLPLGTIPVDSIYSPVQRVRYSVEATRVGKFTNYDRLILEIWTDGTVTPDLALMEAAKIYRKHLNPFVLHQESRDDYLTVETPATSEYNSKNRQDTRLTDLLDKSISELELSVRARNCLDGANIQTIRDLVTMSEPEVMNLKNLGKTSITEIKTQLAEHGLSLGMRII